jgi:hypothetical protein
VADLSEAKLYGSNLSGVDLSGTKFRKAVLSGARLYRANLFMSDLSQAKLFHADLCEAKLIQANFNGANLREADLTGAKLMSAFLSDADLRNANLNEVNLNNSFLVCAQLVGTSLEGADISNCRIYGISAWNLRLSRETKQYNLVITQFDEPKITVDNIEVAQFIYLLLNNENIRNVIDTIGKKGVLIIGRFSEKRLKILHAIRDELRSQYDFLPIMFEFNPLAKEPTIKTLYTLAHLSRFVIADLTDAKSVLQELATILKDLPTLPVKPIIHESDDLPPMGDSFFIMKSMLKPYIYTTKDNLLSDLKNEVIDPAEERIEKFEAQLSEIRREWFPWQQE